MKSLAACDYCFKNWIFCLQTKKSSRK